MYMYIYLCAYIYTHIPAAGDNCTLRCWHAWRCHAHIRGIYGQHSRAFEC